jgi:hypothetical protein
VLWFDLLICEGRERGKEKKVSSKFQKKLKNKKQKNKNSPSRTSIMCTMYQVHLHGWTLAIVRVLACHVKRHALQIVLPCTMCQRPCTGVGLRRWRRHTYRQDEGVPNIL